MLALLRSRRFAPLFWTQLLGAFNDNVFKSALVVALTFGAFRDGAALETDALVNHPLIPDALERRLYILVVRVVLRVLSDAIGTLDGRALLGRMLAVTQARAAARTEPRAHPSVKWVAPARRRACRRHSRAAHSSSALCSSPRSPDARAFPRQA